MTLNNNSRSNCSAPLNHKKIKELVYKRLKPKQIEMNNINFSRLYDFRYFLSQ